MDKKELFQQFLRDLLDIYNFSHADGNWQKFWKEYHSSRLSIQENELEDFINSQCHSIAGAMALLGKDNPSVKGFLSILPLRYSKAILSWPNPTPEEVRLLMTD